MDDKNNTINNLQTIVSKFCQARDWGLSIADEKSQVSGVLSHHMRKMKPLSADKRATKIKHSSSSFKSIILGLLYIT